MTGKHIEPNASTEHTPVSEFEPSVETQRAELADTVAALAAKADVPTRVQNSANAQIQKAKAIAQENPQILAASAGSLLGAIIVLIVLRRRRSHRRILL
ncbi:DUF3618 domain-containing protein [Rhodococcus sp. H29-C3]|uniref:DUF3618 domain-containing protein n=1 Tax=Rhodococcus sp. H29-C3 TaxID=3046307 RepID=UPI0024B9D0EF|nr:DUF3618 domain-containing protein [Rhodococcus sp. H29-C3]MDJ0361859.1 DUF3618 domain-containing protein [Rhodococcus sp. H29-C3]